MNPFQKSENKGRQLFATFLNQIKAIDIEFTKDKYNPVDVYFTYKGSKVVGEIKVRDKQYKDYPTHIIETMKYNSLLISKAANKCDFAYYINFFGDNYMYLYSTNTIKNSSTQKYLHCNKTTAINTGKTDKRVLEIDADKAQKFIKNNGIWRKINN